MFEEFELTVNKEMNDARPASAVSSPIASIRYPKLTHNPNSIPALRILISSRARNTNGKNGMADITNLTAEKVAGSMIVSTPFTTGMSLATVCNQHSP